jgi:hypothetical protein
MVNRIMPLFVYLFFAAFLAIGLAILGVGVRALWQSQQVHTWPTVQGMLLERKLVEDDSDGSTYHVAVKYAYLVNGSRYESDRLAYGYSASSGRRSHQAILDKLMRGETVRVHYNPAKPSEAALAYGLNHSTLVVLMFGAIWTIFTLGLFALFVINSVSDTRLIDRLFVQ